MVTVQEQNALDQAEAVGVASFSQLSPIGTAYTDASGNHTYSLTPSINIKKTEYTSLRVMSYKSMWHYVLTEASLPWPPPAFIASALADIKARRSLPPNAYPIITAAQDLYDAHKIATESTESTEGLTYKITGGHEYSYSTPFTKASALDKGEPWPPQAFVDTALSAITAAHQLLGPPPPTNPYSYQQTLMEAVYANIYRSNRTIVNGAEVYFTSTGAEYYRAQNPQELLITGEPVPTAWIYDTLNFLKDPSFFQIPVDTNALNNTVNVRYAQAFNIACMSKKSTDGCHYESPTGTKPYPLQGAPSQAEIDGGFYFNFVLTSLVQKTPSQEEIDGGWYLTSPTTNFSNDDIHGTLKWPPNEFINEALGILPPPPPPPTNSANLGKGDASPSKSINKLKSQIKPEVTPTIPTIINTIEKEAEANNTLVFGILGVSALLIMLFMK